VCWGGGGSFSFNMPCNVLELDGGRKKESEPFLSALL
jgi:hypothetical protein